MELSRQDILEWVAIPFSRGSSKPGLQPRSSALQADSILCEPPGKPYHFECWLPGVIFLSLAENEARNTGPNLRIAFLCVGIKETTKTLPRFAWHREEWHLKQKLGNIWGRNSHHENRGAWAIKAHRLLMTLYERPHVVALGQYRRFKGRQPWIFIGRTDAEAEALILWPPDAKSRFIGKDTDVGRR